MLVDPNIKAVTCYQTTDGRIHDGIETAIKAQSLINQENARKKWMCDVIITLAKAENISLTYHQAQCAQNNDFSTCRRHEIILKDIVKNAFTLRSLKEDIALVKNFF